jgi:hypothetical protein
MDKEISVLCCNDPIPSIRDEIDVAETSPISRPSLYPLFYINTHRAESKASFPKPIYMIIDGSPPSRADHLCAGPQPCWHMTRGHTGDGYGWEHRSRVVCDHPSQPPQWRWWHGDDVIATCNELRQCCRHRNHPPPSNLRCWDQPPPWLMPMAGGTPRSGLGGGRVCGPGLGAM